MLDVDRDRQRISLGLKQTQTDPWQRVIDETHQGDVVVGRITKVVTFGAFAEILSGVEGLIHISELADHHVENPRDVVNQGDEVNVKVIEIDPERRRLSLSLKRVEAGRAGEADRDGRQHHGRAPRSTVPELGLSDEVFAEADGRPAAEPEAGRRAGAVEPSPSCPTSRPRARAGRRARAQEAAPEPEPAAETEAEPERGGGAGGRGRARRRQRPSRRPSPPEAARPQPSTAGDAEEAPRRSSEPGSSDSPAASGRASRRRWPRSGGMAPPCSRATRSCASCTAATTWSPGGREHFGAGVIDGVGAVDRAALAARVFADASAAAVAGVAAAAADRRASSRAGATNGWRPATPLLVHEAPTLFEAGIEDRYDTIVLVTAPAELREQRRPGAAERMAHQLPEHEKAARSRPCLPRTPAAWSSSTAGWPSWPARLR